MASGFTAFMTYMLVPENNITTGITQGYGYSKAIHCNYIKKIFFNDLTNKEFNIFFDNVDDFKFLSISGGSGFTAHYLIVLAQLVDNSLFDSIDDVKPLLNEKWKIFDVTNQIVGYQSGQTLSGEDICSTVFRVPISQYYIAESYDLNYLNYPQIITGSTDNNLLCFGDETYFMGNVTTSIEAVAYTMDLAINLPLNQFNTSNNVTWDSTLDNQVFISEIGLYDENKNLVGIAKLNDPIPKDDTISRTIVFAMDF